MQFIIKQKQQPDEVLVSFDVVFTNVPKELAINVARRRLTEDETLEDRTCLDVDQIITLLCLCLEAMYRGSYYRQSFGTAMDSLLSFMVANLVMEERE